jgi:hypothetical protein
MAGDASQRDAELRRETFDYVDDDRDRVPVVLLAREGRTWGLYRPVQQMGFDTIRGSWRWVIRLGFACYWALAAAAIVGVIVLRRARTMLLPLVAVVVTVTIATAVGFGQTRYRAAAEPVVVLLAAAAIAVALERVSSRRRWPQGHGRGAQTGTSPPEEVVDVDRTERSG